ncbi:MAG: DUF4340 domain-containing protein [Polyangiales bacterium]
MKNRLWIALAVFVAVLALVVLQLRERGEEPDAAKPKTEESTSSLRDTVFGKVSADTLDALEIKGPDGPAAKLVKRDGRWNLAEPVDAPADQEAADAVAMNLAELEIVRLVAQNPENHDRLGVTDAKAVHVTASAGGKPVMAILIGGYGAGNTLVRKPGSNDVYAAKGSINYIFNKELRSWRDRKIVDLDASSVTEVAWQNGKTALRFARNADTQADSAITWVLAKGMKLPKDFDAGKVQAAVLGLAKLRASDFADGATAESVGIDASSPTVTLTLSPAAAPSAESAEGNANAPAAPTSLTLRLGSKVNGVPQFHVMVDGDPRVYRVIESSAERIDITSDAFKASANPPPAAPDQGGMPGMGAMPQGDPNNIPPDVYRDIQRQIQAAQQRGGQ